MYIKTCALVINTEHIMIDPRFTTGWGRWVVELYEVEVGEPFPFTADEIATLADTSALQSENLSDPKTLLVSLACELARYHTQNDTTGPDVYVYTGEFFDDVIHFIRQYGWFRRNGALVISGSLRSVFAYHYELCRIATVKSRFRKAMLEPRSSFRPLHPLIEYEEAGRMAFKYAVTLMLHLAELELGEYFFRSRGGEGLVKPSLESGFNMMS